MNCDNHARFPCVKIRHKTHVTNVPNFHTWKHVTNMRYENKDI